MNFRDLTIYQTVVREKSITKASRLLYMTPQGVSKVIKNLEGELNCTLLVRTLNGMELTESGRCFEEYVTESVERFQLMKNKLLHIEQKNIESSEFQIHHLIKEKCRQAGFEPNIVFATSGFSLCHKMVKANKGISVTVDFIFEDMKMDGLVKIPFSDGEYEWKVCMLTRKDEMVGQAVELFQRHVKDWIRQIQNGSITR